MERIKQYIDPDSFKRSLSISLTIPQSMDAPITRIRGRIARCGGGTLHIKFRKDFTAFYKYIDGEQIYMPRSSTDLYPLARKKYLQNLLKLLELKSGPADSEAFANKLDNMMKLIDTFTDANLDLARIVMTKLQYEWFTGKFKQKKPEGKGYRIATVPHAPDATNAIFADGRGLVAANGGRGGCDKLRSKSEIKIDESLIDFAIPFHYEEQLLLNVQPLFESLCQELNNESPYYMGATYCRWNVPKEYEWMNSSGSIWPTYDPRTGCVTIYPDFTIMLADGTLMYWEHEGLSSLFHYRCNASERMFVMLHLGYVSQDNFIATFEQDCRQKATVDGIIASHILAKLWF